MVTCPYCQRSATVKVPSTPERVCIEHALEFWTGLLRYSSGRSGPCVKNERTCGCPLCEELTESPLRTVTAAPSGEASRDHEAFALPVAS